MNILGNTIKELRKSRKMTQKDLAKLTGFKQNTISNHENGNRQLDETDIRKYATALNVTPQELFDHSKSSNTPTLAILELDKELHEPRHGKWVQYGHELLEEQKREKTVENSKNTVEIHEEPIYTYTVLVRTAAKAGPTGYGFDDNDVEEYYTDQEPPRYDVATRVDGGSMNPDYQDGDILYLRDYGITDFNGQLAVIAINDKSYFKKIYLEDDHLRLESTNPDFPDKYIPFPPDEDTHIKVYQVVGSFTPVEK